MRSKSVLTVRGHVRVVHIPVHYMSEGLDRPLAPSLVTDLCDRGHAFANVHENIVTDSGLGVISRLVGFGKGFSFAGPYGVLDINSLEFSFMRLGSTIGPPTPAAADNDISEDPPTYQINALSVYYPSATSVTIAGVLPQAVSALNGTPITEEGLFVANGAMLAHVTFPAEVKLPTHAMQFEHTFTFARE